MTDYRKLFDLEAGWDAVSADDVKRVASTYLRPEKRTTVVLVPVAADGAPR